MYLVLKYVPLTSKYVLSSISLYLGSGGHINDKSVDKKVISPLLTIDLHI